MMLSSLVAPQMINGPDVEISGLTSDSRAVGEGYLFAALPGTQADGRDYIGNALANGAVAVLSTAGLADIPVPYIGHDNPRRLYADIAAKLYPGQPDILVALTGTNGKSSTIEFLRQIWEYAGYNAACFGTLGVTSQQGVAPLEHTTPDAVALHQTLAGLAGAGIGHAGMEASSHGLAQYRLDGVRLAAVGFTNLTQDHFDYHDNMEDYFLAKSRLFTQLAPGNTPAIINVDGTYGRRMARLAEAAGLDVMRVGWGGEHIRIAELAPRASSQSLQLMWDGKRVTISLPLAGEFQALNAVTALGLAVKTGVEKQVALEALAQLRGVSGRMQLAGHTHMGAPVFVDFAHTPDGLEKLLRGVRPHTMGRIIIVFGCGGDRDPDKRPKMGKIADKLADLVIVTDDNPRTERPADIRAAVLAGCPGAREIAERGEAIKYGISRLQKNDCLVIAGKGHETGQIIGNKTIPFSDIAVAREALS